MHDTPFGEFIPLSDRAGVPVLVRLRERQWGALARLPADKVAEAGYGGGALPAHVAVVRDAFGAHDDSHRPLGAEVAALGPHKVAVAADLAHPHNRLVVDDYELAPDGAYRLRTVGTGAALLQPRPWAQRCWLLVRRRCRCRWAQLQAGRQAPPPLLPLLLPPPPPPLLLLPCQLAAALVVRRSQLHHSRLHCAAPPPPQTSCAS